MVQCLSSAAVGKYVWFEYSLRKWFFFTYECSSSVSNLLILSWSLTSSPLDYVTTLADIHKQQEFASQEEKVPLDLEQSFVFRRLGERKLVVCMTVCCYCT
jgi:hypothetical protein